MNHQSPFLFLMLCLCIAWPSWAQLVPSDSSYEVIEKNRYHYIFTRDDLKYMNQAIEMNETLREIYQKTFAWTLEERASLVLASSRNQIANGFATVSPNTLTFFYPSGFPLIDSFASPYWYSVLLAHESAHLYQLDAKGPVSSLFRKFLGNPILVITPFVPVFIHPNQLAPGFLLEGNAVLNESAHDIGGRLHSGEVRALVYNQIKNNKVTIEHLLNDHLEFPYYTEKYLVGGYFFSFLAKKYGLDKANGFFLEQGQHFINPLVVNKTFRDHFGDSYSILLNEFLDSHRIEALEQKSATGDVVFTSLNLSAMNADESRVWFLIQADNKTPPWLTIITKNDQAWQQESIDLPLGKVFWLNEKPFVATSRQHNARQTENSLYGEGFEFRPEYRSTIPQDWRGGTFASIDGTSQFFENSLLVNGKKMGSVDSSVILTKAGEPVFFKQVGKERVLVRGDIELVRYAGFYGKPMEETIRGGIAFIASTPYGSSLFEVFENQIYRLTNSDLVVDARQLSENSYLVAEVTANGYQYKITTAEPILQPPAVYEYPWRFESSPLKEQVQAIKMASEQTPESRDYSPVRDLRYSSTEISAGYTSLYGFQGFITSTFLDPLFYNAFNLQYQRILDANSAGFQYAFNRYLIKPYIGYAYNEDRVEYISTGEIKARFFYDQRAFVGFTSPFWIWRRWSADWDTNVAYEKEDLNLNRNSENVEITHRARVTYGQDYFLSYRPFRYFSLELAHQTLSTSSPLASDDSIWLGQSLVGGNVGYENFFFLKYTEAVANEENIRLSYSPALLNQFIRVGRVFPEDSVDVENIRAVQLSYRRPFSTPFYFARFPLSLRRTALFAELGYYDYDIETSEPLESNFIDSSYGFEFEGLFIHRVPLIFQIGHQTTSESKQTGFSLQLSSSVDF
jgi:hypothetical protein